MTRWALVGSIFPTVSGIFAAFALFGYLAQARRHARPGGALISEP